MRLLSRFFFHQYIFILVSYWRNHVVGLLQQILQPVFADPLILHHLVVKWYHRVKLFVLIKWQNLRETFYFWEFHCSRFQGSFLTQDLDNVHVVDF